MVHQIYKDLLYTIMLQGEEVVTRNHAVIRHVNLPVVTFDRLPLIMCRNTAANKAIREMQWFLSGDPTCPADLLDWWDGQLNPEGKLLGAYPQLFRDFDGYDQVSFWEEAIKTNPNSRRLCGTTWHPGIMASITELNENKNTPTTCHGSFIQWFVTGDYLRLKVYQRSADMLLG